VQHYTRLDLKRQIVTIVGPMKSKVEYKLLLLDKLKMLLESVKLLEKIWHWFHMFLLWTEENHCLGLS